MGIGDWAQSPIPKSAYKKLKKFNLIKLLIILINNNIY